MKLFVTGASGIIGPAVVSELRGAGHRVVGLARSEKSAKKISDAGAEVMQGDLEDLEVLKQGAKNAEGVIHAGFFHNFTQYAKAAEMDKDGMNATPDATNKQAVCFCSVLHFYQASKSHPRKHIFFKTPIHTMIKRLS